MTRTREGVILDLQALDHKPAASSHKQSLTWTRANWSAQAIPPVDHHSLQQQRVQHALAALLLVTKTSTKYS